MGRLCLVPDIELTVSLTVIGIFFLFVFVFDNQKNINIGMILGNKFILLFNSCATNIAVMWENAVSNPTYFFFLRRTLKKTVR